MTQPINLNHYLSEEIRIAIEQRYYARINEQASLEIACLNPEFMRNMRAHTTLFSDHGVVHVRDVAQKMVSVLEMMNGVLIPARSPHRLAFMQGYGVIMAYLHDIGMVDFSKFGRVMHAEFASQSVFSLEFDPIVDTIWTENWGNIAWRLTNLATRNVLLQPPREVLREMLALSNCHSKSKVPIELLTRPPALRQLMHNVLGTNLEALYLEQQLARINRALETPHNPTEFARAKIGLAKLRAAGADKNAQIGRYYTDLQADSFQWLESPHPDGQALLADIIDTLRVLRCADALRQRGEVLKTSGSYEVFIDRTSGNAIYALRYGSDQLYLLELDDPISAGEANIASSELDREGNLRISFQRGQFDKPEATQRAAYASALMVNDVQLDVIDSFRRLAAPAESAPRTQIKDIQILLEETDDNLNFIDLIVLALADINPEAASRVRVVPCLNQATEFERNLYLQSPPISWDIDKRREILCLIEKSGHKISAIDPRLGFNDVKLAQIDAGITLIEAGAPASFVYVPLEAGLRIYPLGGYPPFFGQPWAPLGTTGVIRGAPRNATIVAEKPVRLLIIPKSIFLRFWHHTYSETELVQRFEQLPR